ncbi:MAG: hypothetical protein ACFFAS_06740 [Promethearchaeota archaeon]
MKKIDYLKKYWYFIIIIVIFIIFIINPTIAIISTLIILCLAMITYLPSLSSSSRLKKYMSEYSTIEDAAIADKLLFSLEEVQTKMFKLSKNQKRNKWLIVRLNNRYIFYNEKAIITFRQLYYRGLTDKRIFEEMRRSMSIRTRSEVKAIELTLIKHQRLEKRSIINASDRMLPLYNLD